MSQSVKFLHANLKKDLGSPNAGQADRRVPGLCQSAAVAESVNTRFSKDADSENKVKRQLGKAPSDAL